MVRKVQKHILSVAIYLSLESDGFNTLDKMGLAHQAILLSSVQLWFEIEAQETQNQRYISGKRFFRFEHTDH